MVDALMAAIGQSLHKQYGHVVYTCDLPQGFVTPSFYIQLIDLEEHPYPNDRYRRNASLEVVCFYEGAMPFGMMQEMLDLLEYVQLPNGSLLRGIGRSGVVGDEVHLLVHYPYMMTKKKQAEPAMAELSVQQRSEPDGKP